MDTQQTDNFNNKINILDALAILKESGDWLTPSTLTREYNNTFELDVAEHWFAEMLSWGFNADLLSRKVVDGQPRYYFGEPPLETRKRFTVGKVIKKETAQPLVDVIKRNSTYMEFDVSVYPDGGMFTVEVTVKEPPEDRDSVVNMLLMVLADEIMSQ